jgi:anti-sigma B factor antagonist
MVIQQRVIGDIVVLSVVGKMTRQEEASVHVAAKVHRFVQDGFTSIVLDLEGVPYVDSSGLGELVQAYADVRSRGGRLWFTNLSSRLRDVLARTRLLAVFDDWAIGPPTTGASASGA